MGERNYLKLNDLSSYKVAFELSNYIWEAVKKWDYLAAMGIGIFNLQFSICNQFTITNFQ